MKIFSFFILILLTVFIDTISLFAHTAKQITITSDDIKYTPEIGSIRTVTIHNTHSFKLADMNKDGRNDMVAYTTESVNYISIRTTDRLSIAEIPLKKPLSGSFYCRDITNDSIPEVFFISLTKTTVYLNIYDIVSGGKRQIKIFKGENIFSDKFYDVYLYDVKTLLRSDGTQLLLLELSAGHDDRPRGVLAFTLPDLKPAWNFLVGSYVSAPLTVADINNDGKNEILFSTVATDNGVSLNGYSDDTSYFGVLDEDGNELFKQTYAGPLSYCFFNVIAPANDVLIYGYSNNEKTGQPDIFLLNGRTFGKKYGYSTQIRRQYVSNQMNSTLENPDFLQVYSDAHNRCYFLDKQLRPAAILQFPGTVAHAIFFKYATGTFYYLFAMQDIAAKSTVLLLFNNRFEMVGKQNYPVQMPANFLFDQIGQDGAVYFKDDLTRMIYEWYLPADQLKPAFNWNRFVYKHQTLFLILSALVLIVLAFAAIANLISRKNLNIQKYKSLSGYFMDNPYEAVVLVNDEGIISGFNRAFKRLFSPLHPDNYLNKTIHALLESLGSKELQDSIQKVLNKEILFHRIAELDILVENRTHKVKTEMQSLNLNKNSFMVALKFLDLTSVMRADRISNWAAIAQKLAHEIKNPLMSMTLSLGRLEKQFGKQGKESDAAGSKYFDFIREDIERMRDSANRFMRFTSSLDFSFTECQLNDLIKEIAHDYEFIFSERIDFTIEPSADLPLVRIDIEQTKQVLKYIIDNGIDAVEGHGTLHIKTALIERIPEGNGLEERYAQITIADSGTGIAKEDLAKIFEPGFTTKETGSGFGLAIAKHVIEEQGGSIAFSGRKDVGTIVTIEFPVTG